MKNKKLFPRMENIKYSLNKPAQKKNKPPKANKGKETKKK